MGIFSENFYTSLFAKPQNGVSGALDEDIKDPEFEKKHPRASSGAKGGQFTFKKTSLTNTDNLDSSAGKTVTLPDGRQIDVDFASLYRDDKRNLRSRKFSPFLKSIGRSGDISPEMENVLDRLFGGEDVPDEEIEATPEWSEAMAVERKYGDKLRHAHGVSFTNEIDTPERKAFRESILNAAMTDHITKTVPIGGGLEFETNEGLEDGESYDVEKGRTAFITMGFPAAGKSTTYANPLAKKYKARLCDSDTVKKVIPEFQNGYGGNLVHLESKAINEEILRRAIEQGDNIVYPILGYKPKEMEGLIDRLHENGYKVCLCYKDMPSNIAKGRLLVRFLQKGRYLPLSCISKAASGLHPSYSANKQKADAYIRSTNTKPYGGIEEVIEQKGELSDGII